MTKVCSRCQIELPPTEFSPNHDAADGRSAWCRPCHRQVRQGVEPKPVSLSWFDEEWYAIPKHYFCLPPHLLRAISNNLLGAYYGTRHPANDQGWLRPKDLPYKEALTQLGVVQVGPPGGWVRLVHTTPLTIRKFPARPPIDKSRFSGHDLTDVAEWVFKSLNMLEVDWSPEDSPYLSPYELSQTQVCLRKCKRHLWNLTIGDYSRRFYHSLCVGGSRGARKWVKMGGEFLTDIDIHCAFPSMLGGVVDESERKDYSQVILEGDIYEDLGAGLGRDQAKEQMMILFAGQLHPSLSLHHEFSARWPKTAERIVKIKSDNGSLQRILQNMESEIMLAGVGRECLKRGIPFISLHDGALVPPSYRGEVEGLVTEHYERLLHFPPRIQAK